MKKILLIIVPLFISIILFAQKQVTLHVYGPTPQTTVAAASVAVDGKNTSITDSNGISIINVAEGMHTFHISAIGYNDASAPYRISQDTAINFYLTEKKEELENVTVVSSTRNNQNIENSPIKVEVLGREEMDEENTIKPGNIASILGDVSGVQIQQTSATSGNANVHIQGLDGRYTQILRDGMPLYEGFSGGFGILTIPPLDLGQIELIKGSASTLYGGGAIGGLVNIISRRPKYRQDAVFTLNQTTLRETNFNTFIAKRNDKIGYTFFGGYTHQGAVDVNKDGFSDVPKTNSFILHPRLFFYLPNTTVTVGYSGAFDARHGGDMQVLADKADNVHRYFEKNNSARHSGELMAEHSFNDNSKIYFKNSISHFDNKYTDADFGYTGRQLSYYSELSYNKPYGAHHNFVGGITNTGSHMQVIAPAGTVVVNDLQDNAFGIFAQNTWQLKEATTIELGLRDDIHNRYGNFILPRAAVFHRFDAHWAARAGVGFGYKTPDPYSYSYFDYTPDKINVLPAGLKAEKSVGYNAEFNYRKDWGSDNIFINQAFFLTSIQSPLVADMLQNGTVNFYNAGKPVISKGFDTYIKATVHAWELYVGYTYTIAERKYLSSNTFIPLTPKNRMAFTMVRDFDKAGWRVGLEGSYNGAQHRVDYSLTPGYMFMAAMVEKKIKDHWSIVLNCENLLDYRQTKVEQIYTGTITHPEFVPLWAPIDGRVANLSVRFAL